MIKKSLNIIYLAICLLFVFGCINNKSEYENISILIEKQSNNKDYNINNYNKFFKSVPLNKTSDICIDINMNSGKLNITNGSKNLFDANIIYKEENQKPIIEYTETNNRGSLTISHSQLKENNYHFNNNNQYRNLWDLKLDNHVLIDFDIKFGAGNASLELSDLLINNLNIRLGAGKIKVNLNANKALKNIDLEMGVSDAEIDMRNIDHDITGKITGGIGKIKLILPKNTGVKINLSKGIGKLQSKGLTKQNYSYYTNDAYGNTQNNIELDINAGIGKIELAIE